MNLPVPHVDTLESRIREELIALGLFEPQEVCVAFLSPPPLFVDTLAFLSSPLFSLSYNYILSPLVTAEER